MFLYVVFLLIVRTWGLSETYVTMTVLSFFLTRSFELRNMKKRSYEIPQLPLHINRHRLVLELYNISKHSHINVDREPVKQDDASKHDLQKKKKHGVWQLKRPGSLPALPGEETPLCQ